MSGTAEILAITFPFNVIVGIPIFWRLATIL